MANHESGAERVVRTLPRLGVETAPKTPESGKTPEPTKKSLRKRLANVLKSRLVRLGLATGVIGIGGPAVYHHINFESELSFPAVSRDVGSVPGFYLNLGKSAVGGVDYILNNKDKLPEIPPESTPAPTAEIEIVVPESFSVEKEQSSRMRDDGKVFAVEYERGTIRQNINTIPLTEENLDAIVANNPDSLSDETYALNEKYIFFPIQSAKNVSFEVAIVDDEINNSERGLIKYKRTGGTVFDLHDGDKVQLFVPKAEVFRFPARVAEGTEYYTQLLVKETLPDGTIKFYEVEIYKGSMLDVEIADEFRNAPVIQGGNLPRLWLSQTGQPASMISNGDGTFTAPDLLEIKKDGLRLLIRALGNTVLEFYTAVDENGDTKAVTPS